MSKEKASYKCLSIIMLDSVVKVKKKYYPQTLLEECKYEIKKTKMENLTDDELEASSYLMMKMILPLMMIMKRNLTMRKIMINLMNNSSNDKKSILIIIKA